MTEVTYTGGQRGTTAISDVWIQGLEVWQQTAVKQSHMTVTCDLWIHKVKSLTAPQSCLQSCIFHQDLRNLEGNQELGRMQGDVSFLSFIPVPPNTGVTVLTLNQYVLTLHQPASLSLCPFVLPLPKVFGYLSHKTLLKPWQANLPRKGLKKGWKALGLKKWYCKRIFTPCLYK